MNSKKIRFLVEENRVGMANEILSALASKNINIITMEIHPPYISIKIECEDINFNQLQNWIKGEIKEILDVTEIDMMDSEKLAMKLQTIINSMTDGVIAVDKLGNIEYFNSKSASLFNITHLERDININSIIPKEIYDPNIDIDDKNSIEVCTKIRNKKLNLILNIKHIKNHLGIKLGALLIFKEMGEVRKLIQTISGPSMVDFDDIIGESDSIKNTISLAKLVSKTESNVLILGESGTGKELFARAIHKNSTRSNGPFVAVNCSAVPETLLESEFFGYEKNAFTGASKTGKQGLFELATGGSIFLDEIGDLPIHLQGKILRAIQEKHIRRVSGEKEIPIDVRIISATHRDLQDMVQQGTFREDLYYRLNVVPVQILPLRKRKEDIPVLTEYFIQVLSESMGKKNIQITDEALDKLLNHHWQGNVRELQNIIERAIIFAKDKIEINHIMINNEGSNITEKNVDESKADSNFPVNLPRIIENIEYKYIRNASKEFNSSREIAKALGISHTTVINKLKNYNLL
ncbi:sigma 54-interacting transcriptional regulator [Proteiniborus sp. MB09-C3]|uniref:sigma 54-interacting transcriptional regulator n=1 Tax=Proteiniborus sp. MB09-C3 TaxID=3050072 RepID=UPI002555A02D|nr:sigma 54-interacting transcriptional regulator [Proteiniborus sp. MB09-C3]WIV11653.1 sigma 54-interacting transcriptional regulator [Proteiniborus sp. MB09-C3]